jgi:hypothetical protein
LVVEGGGREGVSGVRGIGRRVGCWVFSARAAASNAKRPFINAPLGSSSGGQTGTKLPTEAGSEVLAAAATAEGRREG